ncbi:endonuclease/exonuclease/phosphatase family protein [Aestuariimicrobium soli]|uniref:endonuclease/exonuclease/phosphatase family protein n=1 Tax=Aestuariimicrobium soli TaxID=2035834 RepID=UPI003EBD44C6
MNAVAKGLGALLVIAVAAALLVVGAPGLFGWSMVNPLGQIVAFRGAMAAAGVACLLVVGLPTAVVALARRRRPGVTALALLLVLALFTVGNLAVLASRGLDGSARVTWGQLATHPENSGEITLLSLNTLWDEVPVATMVEHVRDSGADVIAMPEAEAPYSRELAADLQAAGLGSWQVFATSNPWPNAMLVSSAMGEYRLTDTDIRGLVIADPVGHDGPRLMTVHATPPPQPWPLDSAQNRHYLKEWWQRTTTQITAEIRSSDHVIAAGDFNATVDHETLDFGDHVNALDGAGGWGTWPRRLPSWAGAAIDHVVVDPTHWRIGGRWVLDEPRSDHRALVVRLTRIPAQ